MSQNSIKVQLDNLNKQSETYFANKKSLFQIEKESLLYSCRLLYEAILDTKIETEKEVAQKVEPTNIDEKYKRELQELKLQIEALKNQTNANLSPKNENISETKPQWKENVSPSFEETKIITKSEKVEPINPIEKEEIQEKPFSVQRNIPQEPKIEKPQFEPPKINTELPKSFDFEPKEPVSESFQKIPDPIKIPETRPNTRLEPTNNIPIEPNVKVESGVRFEKPKSRFSLKTLINNQADGSLLNNLNQKPIDNLKKAIGLNEKFLYIRELFDNDHQEFASLIDTLNNMNSLEEAEQHIAQEVLPKKKWDLEDEHSLSFLTVIYRRFL